MNVVYFDQSKCKHSQVFEWSKTIKTSFWVSTRGWESQMLKIIIYPHATTMYNLHELHIGMMKKIIFNGSQLFDSICTAEWH